MIAASEHLVLRNTSRGFSMEVLEGFRSLPGVAQVDGRGLREGNRFAEIVIRFDSPGLAEKFSNLMLETFGDEVERVG